MSIKGKMKTLCLYLAVSISLSCFADGQKQVRDQATKQINCSAPNYVQQDIDIAINHYLNSKLSINSNDIVEIFNYRNEHFLPFKHVPLALASLFADDMSCVVTRHLKSRFTVTFHSQNNQDDCNQKQLDLEITMTDGAKGSRDFDSRIELIKPAQCL